MVRKFFLEASQNQGYLWLLASLAFLLLELSTPGLFFFVAFALGCVFTSAAAFLGQSTPVQCITFLTTLMVSFWFLKKRFAVGSKGRSDSKTNLYALTGKDAVVTIEIKPLHSGRVKLKGELWPAKTEEKMILNVGDVVHVVRVEGNHLIVKKA